MAMYKYISLNGFTLTTENFTLFSDFLSGRKRKNSVNVIINLGSIETTGGFMDVLKKLSDDSDEINSVMLAEDSIGMFLQYMPEEKKHSELLRILNSQYASDEIKNVARRELGLPGWKEYSDKNNTPQPKERKKVPGFIYLVRAATGEYKIGRSIDVNSRLNAFSVQPPFEYKLLHYFHTDDMVMAESLLHEYFSAKRIQGEWFLLSEKDVKEIMEIEKF